MKPRLDEKISYWVRENPWKAVGIIFALYCLAGTMDYDTILSVKGS